MILYWASSQEITNSPSPVRAPLNQSLEGWSPEPVSLQRSPAVSDHLELALYLLFSNFLVLGPPYTLKNH